MWEDMRHLEKKKCYHNNSGVGTNLTNVSDKTRATSRLQQPLPIRISIPTLGRTRVLPLAAALAALAVFVCMPHALADTENAEVVWSATLTQPDADLMGCDNDIAGSECSSDSILTDDDFVVNGTTYAVTALAVANHTLTIKFYKTPPPSFRSGLVLYVNGTAFPFADATQAISPGGSCWWGARDCDFAAYPDTGMNARWNSVSLDWNASDTVQINMTALPPGDPEADEMVWSGTLVPWGPRDSARGCWSHNTIPACAFNLYPYTFTYDGHTYEIDRIALLTKGSLFMRLDSTIPGAQSATLFVGDTPFNFDASTTKSPSWHGTGLDWSAVDSVRMSLRINQYQETSERAPATSTAPVITLAGASQVTVPVGSTYVEPGYTATDREDGDLTGSVTVTGTVDTTRTGTYTLYYDVTDISGNAAVQQSRTVSVVDTTSPVITLAGASQVTVPVNTTYTEPGYTATDNYDGNLTGSVTVTGTVDTARTGTYTLYYDVTDRSGNAAVQQSRTVSVVDTTSPVITLAGASQVTVPVGSTYVEPGYTATDREDGDLTGSVTVTGTVDTTRTGTYTLYYDVTDISGNAAVQQSRTVSVVDTTSPVITLAGASQVTVPINTAYTEPGYTATDNYDGNLTGSVTVTGTVDTARTGTYTLYYDVTDRSGNAAVQQSRTVSVVDTTPPDTSLTGTGNSTSVHSNPAQDTTPPVITLTGASQVTIPVGSTYFEPGYTATDDYDGDLTGNVTIAIRISYCGLPVPLPEGCVDPNGGVPVTGAMHTRTSGTFTLYYDVTDSSGNAAVQQVRTVNVVDKAPPVITLTGDYDITIPLDSTYSEPGYTATDDYDGDLTGSVTVTGTVDTTQVGTYTLYYDVTDRSGNAAVQQFRTIYVEDIPDPQAGLPEVVKRYDTDGDGVINQEEWMRAADDYYSGLLYGAELNTISMHRS